MTSDVHYVARHVDRVASTPEPRTVFALVTAPLGLVGVALFGIGLVEEWGGIWSAIGFVVCVALVVLSGSALTASAPSGEHKAAARSVPD
jgi:glucose uptake protein GlcU